jgi:pimeloyl-ACP methyl ester carboxylesterase
MCPEYFSGTDETGKYFDDLYYTKAGHGPPIIALHGFGATSFSWRHIAPVLQKRNTVFMFD